MILGPPRASLHKEMLLTWKLPWWDSKSPKKENLGSGTLGMRTFLILKRTWTVWSDGLAPPEQSIHVERPPHQGPRAAAYGSRRLSTSAELRPLEKKQSQETLSALSHLPESRTSISLLIKKEKKAIIPLIKVHPPL